jgi:signal transduction histidine kinase
VGLLVCGYKLDEKPLNSEDLELMRQVLNQTALALENAQLLDELHQQLEEVLRLKQYSEGIIQSSPAGIAVLGRPEQAETGEPRRVVLSANLAFAALVGRERRALLGEDVREVLPVDLPGPGQGMCEARLCSGPGVPERYLQLSVAELGQGEARQSILMVQDVSERVRIERELKEKERLASLGMLAAGVAHEVNTPITGISSYAQMLLEETPEGDPRHDLLRKMERQTFRAARIVSSLLDFARNRKGEHRSVDLASVLATAVDELADKARERGVEIHWHLPAEELVVEGSETELTQVFVNLVGNAVDAMGGGGDLTLGLAVDGSSVQASVEDTGTGIDPAALGKIFQPFFSTKLAQGGTGLGLSISYEIVRRHGGELTVSSRPGEGSRFVVELPRVRQGPRRQAGTADPEAARP